MCHPAVLPDPTIMNEKYSKQDGFRSHADFESVREEASDKRQRGSSTKRMTKATGTTELMACKHFGLASVNELVRWFKKLS